MLFYRKWWIIPIVLIAFTYAICKLYTEFISNWLTLILYKINDYIYFDVMKWVRIIQQLKSNLECYSEHVLQLIIVFLILIALWLIINLLTGQFWYDFKSVRIVKFLVRDVTENNHTVTFKEEKKLISG